MFWWQRTRMCLNICQRETVFFGREIRTICNRVLDDRTRSVVPKPNRTIGTTMSQYKSKLEHNKRKVSTEMYMYSSVGDSTVPFIDKTKSVVHNITMIVTLNIPRTTVSQSLVRCILFSFGCFWRLCCFGKAPFLYIYRWYTDIYIRLKYNS